MSVDRRGRPLQHRVAEDADRVGRHRRHAYRRRDRGSDPSAASDAGRIDGGADAADGPAGGATRRERVGERVRSRRACTSARPSVGTEHLRRPSREPRSASTAAASAVVVAGELGERAERRVAERRGGTRSPASATSAGRPRTSARTTSWSGMRVCTSSRVSARGRPASSCAPRVSEPVRLRRGAVPRREQLLVEVEVRDERRAGGGARSARCSTASVPIDDVGVAAPRRSSASTSTTRAPGQQRRQLLARRASRPARSTRSRVAPHSGQITGRSAVRSQRSERVARVAREQPEPAAPVEHAHREPVASRAARRRAAR